MLEELNWAQEAALDNLAEDLLAGETRLLVDTPTRTGKTRIYLTVLDRLNAAGGLPASTIILTERKALSVNIMRDAARFTPLLIKGGLIERHTPASIEKVGIANVAPIMVMTYSGWVQAKQRGLLSGRPSNLKMLDEGQHSLSVLRRRLLAENQKAIHIAFTATPEYSKKKGLKQAGYKQSYRVSIQEAVDGALQAETRNVLVQMEGLEGSLDDIALDSMGDFDANEIEKIVHQNVLFQSAGDFLETWHSPRSQIPLYQRSGFVFCNSINHAVATSDYLNERFRDLNGGKDICAAVWGAMGDNKIKDIVAAHEAGEIRYLASANFAIEGLGTKKHSVVVNLTPSRSGVVVGQRGGRVTGADSEDPGKEAIVADFVFPSTINNQLLYADATGGALFEISQEHKHKYKKRQHGPVHPTPIIKGLKILATPDKVKEFIQRREFLESVERKRSLRRYTRPMQKAMMKAEMTSFDAVWRGVRLFMLKNDLMDEPRYAMQVTRQAILNLMLGKTSPTLETYKEYAPAAIALSAVLKSNIDKLFGGFKKDDDRQVRHHLLKRMHDPEWIYNDGYDVTLEPEMVAYADNTPSYEEFHHALAANEEPFDLDHFIYQKQLKARIAERFVTITPKEEYAIRASFGLSKVKNSFGKKIAREDSRSGAEGGQTLEQVGEVWGLSRERVRQIIEKAFRKLRHPTRGMEFLLEPHFRRFKPDNVAEYRRELTGELERLKEKVEHYDNEIKRLSKRRNYDIYNNAIYRIQAQIEKHTRSILYIEKILAEPKERSVGPRAPVSLDVKIQKWIRLNDADKTALTADHVAIIYKRAQAVEETAENCRQRAQDILALSHAEKDKSRKADLYREYRAVKDSAAKVLQWRREAFESVYGVLPQVVLSTPRGGLAAMIRPPQPVAAPVSRPPVVLTQRAADIPDSTPRDHLVPIFLPAGNGTAVAVRPERPSVQGADASPDLTLP